MIKGLWITFSDSGTPYDFDKKIFTDPKEALESYRKFKKITKYKIQFCKCWVYYHGGRIGFIERKPSRKLPKLIFC